jgi:hypothetical protein
MAGLVTINLRNSGSPKLRMPCTSLVYETVEDVDARHKAGHDE